VPSTYKPDTLNVADPFGVPVINAKASCAGMWSSVFRLRPQYCGIKRSDGLILC
jgi:hypothetical protein